jgi:FkbH-like protein
MECVNLSFNSLLKILKRNTDGYSHLTIAVMAEFASQHFVKALRGALILRRFSASIWEAEYNSVDSTVLSQDSELYEQHFDYIIILPSSHKLNKEFSHDPKKAGFADRKINHLNSLVSLLTERTKSKVIYCNYHELNDGIFGNFANKTDHSFLYQVRKLNYELMKLAIAHPNLYIADVADLIVQRGSRETFDPKLYVHADIVYSLDFLALLAQTTSQIISAIQGSFKKCVIVDLDNTLWGGVIGDDGLENIEIGDLGLGKAFTGLQTWLLDLKNRGIILAVCSKNTEGVAREVFEKHPGMTLKLSDISVFAVNWETKVDNILFIQSVLNIGFDSMVFLDDNPFERGIVKSNIPEITVPDLPSDPAEYLPYLQSLNLFETASFSEEDTKRTKQYQEEAGRIEFQKSFKNEDEFLRSLNMEAIISPVDNFTRPRVAQLMQRSNQFNLRTIRYTDEDIRKLMNDPFFLTLTISLSDVYGDYGLISAVILEKKSKDHLFIDSWIMSCRVLKRGVESFLLNEIVLLAEEQGFKYIEGEYIPTPKNGLVKDHYTRLGFESLHDKGLYMLPVKTYKSKITFIQKTIIHAHLQ